MAEIKFITEGEFVSYIQSVSPAVPQDFLEELYQDLVVRIYTVATQEIIAYLHTGMSLRKAKQIFGNDAIAVGSATLASIVKTLNMQEDGN